jgi:hypothetical protein
MVILPGLLLALAISSGTDFAGTDGCTTSTPAPRDTGATGVKSRISAALALTYSVVFHASADVVSSSV